MQAQLLNAIGTVVLEFDIPNEQFQGLAKGVYWEVTSVESNTPVPYTLRMRISVDGQSQADHGLPKRGHSSQDDTSTD